MLTFSSSHQHEDFPTISGCIKDPSPPPHYSSGRLNILASADSRHLTREGQNFMFRLISVKYNEHSH